MKKLFAVFTISLYLTPFVCFAGFYWTDLSSNPYWTTNNASRFYWSSGTYYFDSWPGSEEYAYEPLTQWASNQSFAFEFDIKISSVQWGSCIDIGLYDSQMSRNSSNRINVSWGQDDTGVNIVLAATANGSFNQDMEWPSWSTNTWYHNTLIFNIPSNYITLVVYNRETGTHVATLLVPIPGSFSNTNRFALTNKGATNYGTHMTGRIDCVLIAYGLGDLSILEENSGRKVSVEKILLSAHPNPSQDDVKIKFQLPKSQTVNLEILDVQGRTIRTLISEETRLAGEYIVHWKHRNSNIPNGVYFISLTTDNGTSIKKIVALK